MDRPRRIVRSPSLKRKSRPVPLTERVCLEKVLGLSVPCNAAITVCSTTGTVAYPSGCVVVLLNTKKNRQTHIFNTSKKTITAVAFSGDGKYLVTGECGHQPAVRVWDIEEKTQTSEFHGHKFGIHCVAFSPNMRYLVSIGTQHDMMVNVWDWKAGCKFASNKVSSKVSNLAFSEDGSHFVTVGLRHVKFWYLDATKSRVKETVPLHGRASILGDQRNNYFTDVVCGFGPNADKTYSITQSGLLCEFNSKRFLTRWVKLRTKIANALSLSEKEIFIGCADGIIRVFDAATLKYVATLPRPHYIGIDVAAGIDSSHMTTYPADAKYPDTLAVVFDRKQRKISAVYNDHSLYIWDVREVKKVGKIWSYLYHSHCVWGLEMYPSLPDSAGPALPAGSFITCSSDDTIRIWNLEPCMATNTSWRRNIYSHELLKIIYTDPEYNFICDVDYNPAGGTDKTDTSYVGKNGVRSIRVSPDGQHLASGDRVGNIRVYDLRYMDEICTVEAHDGEILALQYYQSKDDASMNLLASASRDRLIHVFDGNQDYSLLHTLDDHSSSITALKFVQVQDKLQLISCGADKSLLFRNTVKNPDLQFSLHRHLVGKTTLYDMDVDPSQKFLATACQDRNVRIYNILTGKQRKCYKGSLGDDGTLIRVQLDPSGSLMATSCSDKNLYVMDFYSGDCLSTMYGHSEIAPGIQFMLDLKHLISVSGDGCSFVWRLHPEFTQQMIQRKRDKANEQLKMSISTHGSNGDLCTERSSLPNDLEPHPPTDNVDAIARPLSLSSPDPRFKLNLVELPTWAQKQYLNIHSVPGKRRASAPTLASEPYRPKYKALNEEADLDSPMTNPSVPRGRWAQRLNEEDIVIKGENDAKIPLSFMNSLDRRRFTVEQETLEVDLRQFSQLRRETIIMEKGSKLKDLPIVMMDEDAADEDEDDEFGLNSSRRVQEVEEAQYSSTDPNSCKDVRYSPRKNRFLSAEEVEKRDEGQEEDEDNAEEQVIYYPSVQDDVEEDDTEENRKETLADSNGKSTERGLDENISDDDMTDELGSSAPSTPLDPETPFISDPAAKEEFFRKTFENIGASPTFSDGSMTSSETSAHPSADSPGHRLSLSSRFLSRAQQSQLRQIAGQTSQNIEEASLTERADPPSPPTKLPASDNQRDNSDSRFDFSRTTGSLRRKKPSDDNKSRNRKRNSAPPQPIRKAFSTTDLSQGPTSRRSTGRSVNRGTASKPRPSSITRDRSSSSPTRGRNSTDKVERHQTHTESSRRRTQPIMKIQRASSAASLEEKAKAVTGSPKSSPRRQRSARQSAPLDNFSSQPNLDETELSPKLTRRSSTESDLKTKKMKNFDEKKDDKVMMPPPITSVVKKNDSFMRFAGKSLKLKSKSLVTKMEAKFKIESSDSDSDKLRSDSPRSVENKSGNEERVDMSPPSPVEIPIKDSNSPDAITSIASDILRWHSSTVSPRGTPSPQGRMAPSRNGDQSPISSELAPLITGAARPHSLTTNGQLDHDSIVSPDRSRLSLPLKRCDDPTVSHSDHTDPAVAQAMERDCDQAITEMKRAVRQASDIYQKVNTGGLVRNGERQHLMSILGEAFREVRTLLSPILTDERAHSVAQTDLDLENLDPEILQKLEPILEHYSSELSDRVLAIVEEKLEEKCKPSPETETDI